MRNSGNPTTLERPPSVGRSETSLTETTKVVSFPHVLKRLIGSTTVILATLLIIAAVAICRIPGQYLDAADGVPTAFRHTISKLSRYLSSNENSDILMLGSSLFLFPSARCDDQMQGKPLCYDVWYMKQFVNDYDKSLYFQKLLNEAGFNSSIKNLSISSSLMSDQSALFETLMESGKRPKMIVCGLAPRDFLDATVRQSITPTRLLLTEYHANKNHNFAFDFSIDGLDSVKTRIAHHIEKSLGRFRTMTTSWVNAIANRPETDQLVRMSTAPRPNGLKDLATYKRIYGLSSKEVLDTQAKHMRKLLLCAKQHGVKVVLINMPLTVENTSLLDAELYNSYVSTIRDAATENNMVFLDIGSNSTFDTKTDFEDSCHMSTQGGKKLFKTVVNAISQEPSLSETLTAKQ